MNLDRRTWFVVVLLALLAALPLVAVATGQDYQIGQFRRILIFAIAAVSLDLILGYGGMVCFGHAAFFGIGAYVVAILNWHAGREVPLLGDWTGTNNVLVTWPAAILVSGGVAALIATISLRTTGIYFIMITLAFAQMIYYFAVSWPAYGGEDGLSTYVRNEFPGLNTSQPLPYFLICYVLLLAGLALFSTLRGSRFGAALEGARQNPTRLAAVGIAPFPVRLVAFIVSAMLTGVAGALFADLNKFVSPSMLSWQMSGELIVLIILGGKARLFGPVAGAMLYVLIEYALGGLTERWQFFLGLALLCVVLFARGGLLGLLAGKARHG